MTSAAQLGSIPKTKTKIGPFTKRPALEAKVAGLSNMTLERWHDKEPSLLYGSERNT